MNKALEIQKILKEADVAVNGTRPWDIRVLDSRFYDRVFADGSVGIGESYMDGDWECDDIAGLVERIFRANLYTKIPKNFTTLRLVLGAKFFNFQSVRRAF